MNVRLDRRGAIAAISAIVMVPVIGFAGLAVDLTRIWLLSARLKTSVDAASLVAARTLRTTTVNNVPTTTTDEAATRALFWTNFHQNGWSSSYLGSVTAQPTITMVSETRVRVTATASLDTTLFSIISRQTTPLRETTLAEREATGLELAIVLDQTSSMLTKVNGVTKLASAQAAVRTMLDILYGSDDTKRNMWVSVVPFARTINIGTANRSMLDESNVPAGWSTFSNQWSGCVEARHGGNDVTDAAPTTNATRMPPYFWSTTYRQVGWSGTTLTNAVAQLSVNSTTWQTITGAAAYAGAGACTDTDAYPAVNITLRTSSNNTSTTTYSVRFCRGANDWRDLSDTAHPTALRSLSTSSTNNAYNPMYAYLRGSSYNFTDNGFLPTSAAGPNMLCALSPILPLTASRATVQAAVNAIEAPTRSAGTTVAAGMQGAFYTLSPNWQNQWVGIATSAQFGVLPLAYNTRNMNKAIVILTDGDNNWQSSYSQTVSNRTYTTRDSPVGTNWFTELMYDAYGRRSDYNTNVPGTDIAASNSSSGQQAYADARLDDRFRQICTNMKAEGIRIYVIGFEVTQGSDIDDMLAECATSTATYIRAPTAAQLQTAFTEVANQLASLRLVE